MRDITAAELATIRTGICPRRTNGTFEINLGAGGRMTDLNLSNRAETGGPEFADAIEAYIKKYPE